MSALAVPLVAVLYELRATQAERDEALAEVRGYRLLSQQAIHKIAEQRNELVRLREQHRDLIDEYRRMREAAMRGTRSAA